MSKNNRTTITTLLLLVIAGAFQQCRKSHDAAPVSKESLAGTYRLSALTTKGQDGTVIDLYAAIDNCQKDDQFKFNVDGSYVQTDAGVSCTPPSDETDTWTLMTGNKIVVAGVPADITSFDGKKLVLSLDGTAMGGFPNPVIETLNKQ